MDVKLIIYDLSSLDQYHKVLVNRILFGYTDNSNKCKYQYKRKGVLDNMPHFRLPKGAIIIRNKNKQLIISIFNKNKVKFKLFDISIKKEMLLNN